MAWFGLSSSPSTTSVQPSIDAALDEEVSLPCALLDAGTLRRPRANTADSPDFHPLAIGPGGEERRLATLSLVRPGGRIMLHEGYDSSAGPLGESDGSTALAVVELESVSELLWDHAGSALKLSYRAPRRAGGRRTVPGADLAAASAFVVEVENSLDLEQTLTWRIAGTFSAAAPLPSRSTTPPRPAP